MQQSNLIMDEGKNSDRCQSVQVGVDRNVKISMKITSSWLDKVHIKSRTWMLEQNLERRLVLGRDSDHSGTHRAWRPGL